MSDVQIEAFHGLHYPSSQARDACNHCIISLRKSQLVVDLQPSTRHLSVMKIFEMLSISSIARTKPQRSTAVGIHTMDNRAENSLQKNHAAV